MTEVKEAEKAPRPNLTGALTAAYGGPFFIAALFKLLQDTLAFVQPQLLRRLLQFVASFKSDDPEPAFHGYILAFGMFACAITQTVRFRDLLQKELLADHTAYSSSSTATSRECSRRACEFAPASSTSSTRSRSCSRTTSEEAVSPATLSTFSRPMRLGFR